MYFHLGQDFIVPLREVICVLDMDTATASKRTQQFLQRMQQENRIVELCDDLPRSAILCVGIAGEIVYLSPLSSKVLQKRAEENYAV